LTGANGIWCGMPGKFWIRHLLLAAMMLVFGLGVTLGTASVLEDVMLAWGKNARREPFEVPDVKPTSARKHPKVQLAGPQASKP
jgi:hypothetical protein